MPDTDKLLNFIDAYEAKAYGSDNDDGELSVQRALCLDAYAGKNIEPAPEGRSQVIDMAVFETVQWIMPSLIKIFAGGDNVVEFDPTGPEDEEVAEQESEYLNYLVMQKNNWDLIVLTWCQDALITKNAYCMAYIEELKQTETERYVGMSEEQATLLLEEDGVEVVAQEIYPDPEDEPKLIGPDGQEIPEGMQEMALVSGDPGITLQPPRNLIDLQIRRVKPKKRLRFQVLPPERCKVGEDTPDFTLDDCNYFEYWEELTLSDLRKMGYDVADDIADDGRIDSLERTARDDPWTLEDGIDDLPDPSMRFVKVRTVWVRYDYDEDGIAELQRVVIVGREVLEREEETTIPVACITPLINTHRHVGTSVADLVLQIQRIKTALLRQGLDSLYLSVNGRNAVSNRVNTDDLLIHRPGAPIRIDTDMPDVGGHILPIPTQFIFPEAMEGLRHMDTVVEARSGVNRMFQGIDESNLNDHNRVGQLSTMAAQRVELIARVFGNGFKRLFAIAHELIIKSGHQAETIKLRGGWVDINPSQWKTGRDMRVVAPFSAGNKDALLQRLMMLGTVQEKMLAGGMPGVTPDNVYNLAQEIAKAADTPAHKFFTDPATLPPPEPPPDHTMIALEIEKQKVDGEMQDEARQAELEQIKMAAQDELERYKVDTNAALQIVLAQIKGEQTENLEGKRAEASERIERMRAQNKPKPASASK